MPKIVDDFTERVKQIAPNLDISSLKAAGRASGGAHADVKASNLDTSPLMRGQQNTQPLDRETETRRIGGLAPAQQPPQQPPTVGTPEYADLRRSRAADAQGQAAFAQSQRAAPDDRQQRMAQAQQMKEQRRQRRLQARGRAKGGAHADVPVHEQDMAHRIQVDANRTGGGQSSIPPYKRREFHQQQAQAQAQQQTALEAAEQAQRTRAKVGKIDLYASEQKISDNVRDELTRLAPDIDDAQLNRMLRDLARPEEPSTAGTALVDLVHETGGLSDENADLLRNFAQKNEITYSQAERLVARFEEDDEPNVDIDAETRAHYRRMNTDLLNTFVREDLISKQTAESMGPALEMNDRSFGARLRDLSEAARQKREIESAPLTDNEAMEVIPLPSRITETDEDTTYGYIVSRPGQPERRVQSQEQWKRWIRDARPLAMQRREIRQEQSEPQETYVDADGEEFTLDDIEQAAAQAGVSIQAIMDRLGIEVKGAR